MAKVAKFVVHSNGAWLSNFDIHWFTHHQDDPSSWSDDRRGAKAYTLAQIEKMRPMLEGFQGTFTIEAA